MATFFQLVIDCHDPSTLVAFWQPLLGGYRVPDPPAPHPTWRDWYISLGVPAAEIEGDGADRLVPTDGNGVNIWFQVVPETKSVKNRLHLDLRVSRGPEIPRQQRRADIEAAVDDIRRRGGSLVRWSEDDRADRVSALVADPEGNEFCLV